MVRKVVTVDEGLHLPNAVRTQISADLVADMADYVSDAEIASSTAALAAVESGVARDQAEAAAASAIAPVDETFADLLDDPGSLTYTAIRETFPGNYRGTYAARPTASTYVPGTRYYATDTKEDYMTDGTSWTVVGSAGNELGYASSSSGPFSTSSTTYVDITAVTTTFMVGERPIELRVDGQIANSSATGITYLGVMLDSVERGRAQSLGIGSNIWHGINVRARVTGLTPGTTHTAKAVLRAQSGTTALAGGENATAPISVQVVTL